MEPAAPVLIVEDDPDIRDAIADSLCAEGFPVAMAGDGREALAWLENPAEPTPSAIVLDVMMPRMSGPEFVREARRSGLLNGTPPIITITASDAHIEGAAAHLHKPFSIDELLGAIRACAAAAP